MNNTKIKMGTNRSFGIVFFVVFFLISLWPVFNSKNILDTNIIIMCVALSFLILGLINSKILSPFNLLWFKFGLFLGKIIAPIVMAFVFFLVITPIGIILRLIGKDVLNLKYSKSKNTYWIQRKNLMGTMKKQF